MADTEVAPGAVYLEALTAFKAAGMNRARDVLAKVTERMRETQAYPDTITYPLSKPIEGPEGETHELVLRDPDAAILNGLSISEVDTKKAVGDTLILIARMANIPPSAAKQIKLRDIGEIGEIIAFFSGSGPQIGES